MSRHLPPFLACAFFILEPVRAEVEITIRPSHFEKSPHLGKTLDARSLEETQQKSAAQALKSLPGLHLNTIGAYGPQSYVRIRGNNPEHTKVRLLGVELNDPSAGGRFDFSHLFSEDVETLSILTGSDLSAIGGTVEIDPKRGGGPARIDLSEEGGSYLTSRTRAQVSGATERHHYFVGGTLLRTGTGALKNRLHGNTVSDWHLTKAFTARVGWKMTDRWDTDLYLSKNDARFDINRTEDALPFKSADHAVLDRNIAIFKNKVRTFEERWEHDMTLSTVSHLNRSSIGTDTFTNKSQTLGVTYDSKIKVRDHHTLLASLGMSQDRVTLSGSGNKRIHARFGELGYETDFLPKIALTLKGRLDQHDFFKTHTTSLARVTYTILPELRLFTSYGTSFRSPTVFDFFASGPESVGNLTLKPMRGRTFEAGTETSPHESVSFGLTYFHQNISDLLVTVLTPEGKFQRINTSRRAQGLELAARLAPSSKVGLRAGYTLLHATDRETGLTPIRVPRHQLSLSLQSTSFQETTLFIEGLYRSSTADTAFFNSGQRRVTLPSSLTVRVGGAYQLTDQVEFNARIENLLNARQEDIYGYPNRGVTVLAGLRVKCGG